MSWQATTHVIAHSRHKGSALLLLLMIANHAHGDGTNAFPSFETLAKESRMSVRQVIRLVQVLEASGELIVTHGGGRSTNEYAINMIGPSSDKMARVEPESLTQSVTSPMTSGVTPPLTSESLPHDITMSPEKVVTETEQSKNKKGEASKTKASRAASEPEKTRGGALPAKPTRVDLDFEAFATICYQRSTADERKRLTETQRHQVNDALKRLRLSNADLSRIWDFERWWKIDWQSNWKEHLQQYVPKYAPPPPAKVREFWDTAMKWADENPQRAELSLVKRGGESPQELEERKRIEREKVWRMSAAGRRAAAQERKAQ